MAEQNKTAVIVGYGPGVGDAVACAFAAEGHDLALVARDASKLAAATDRLGHEGVAAAAFPADAGNEASLLAALEAAKARFGDPAVLVYNAAHWRPGPTLALSPDDLVTDFRTCVAGALAAARAFAPAMQARGRGSILFTGGGFGLHPSPAAPALSIGKASIRALAIMLAQELAPAGVRVGTVTIMGTVSPGTSLDPTRIAQAFVDLHRGAPDAATAEVQIF